MQTTAHKLAELQKRIGTTHRWLLSQHLGHYCLVLSSMSLFASRITAIYKRAAKNGVLPADVELAEADVRHLTEYLGGALSGALSDPERRARFMRALEHGLDSPPHTLLAGHLGVL